MGNYNRRRFLKIAGGSALGFAASASGLCLFSSDGFAKTQNTVAANDIPLWQHAVAKGLFYGAAARYENLYNDKSFSDAFLNECKFLVPENELKWGHLSKKPGEYDFSKADWLFQYAKSNQLRVRGHTLVWHDNLPKWFSETVTNKNAEQVMIKHITTVMSRYRGQVFSWDVVNEAILPTDGQKDGFRNSPWLSLLGNRYIELAFRTAGAVDPQALLVYNDIRLEFDNSTHDKRRESVLKLLDRLISSGTPIHALGIEGHLRSEYSLSPKKLEDFLNTVKGLGLKIILTEMDINDRDLPANITERDNIIAGKYQEYLDVFLSNPAVIGITTWGLSDKYTWISDHYPRYDGLPSRPLLLDDHFKRKPSWYAVAKAFDVAPKRIQ